MEEEEHLRDLPGVKRRNGNENAFARPNGLHQNVETVISFRKPGPDKEERGIPVVEGRR